MSIDSPLPEISYRDVINRLDTPEFADYARAFLAQEEPRFTRYFGSVSGIAAEVEHLLEENEDGRSGSDLKELSLDSVAFFLNRKKTEYNQIKKLLDTVEKT